MIETTDQALECLEAWVGDRGQTFPSERKQAALLVLRALRQARQALAAMPPLRTAPVAGDEELRRLAEEWCATVFAGSDVRWTGMVGSVEAFARRVAEEARRQERERIEGIVRGFAHNEHEVPTNHVVLEILGHIEGGKR